MQSNTVSSWQDTLARRGTALSISSDMGVGTPFNALRSGLGAFTHSSCLGAAHLLISQVSTLALELCLCLQIAQKRWRDHLIQPTSFSPEHLLLGGLICLRGEVGQQSGSAVFHYMF